MSMNQLQFNWDLPYKVQIQRLSEDGILPTKSHIDDAGWDLYSSQDSEILGGRRKTISTSIAMSIPKGYVGLIWPRSGLSVNSGVDVLAGVIDAGYLGEIQVCLLNTNGRGDEWMNSLQIAKGDRIAQIVFHKLPDIKIIEVNELNDYSSRGLEGFGSSGN